MQLDTDTLDAMRTLGDPDADRLVEALFGHLEAGGRDAPSRALVRDLIEYDELPPASFPPRMKAFLEARDTRPQISAETLTRGQRVFANHGPEIMLALACYSLPSAYAAAKGARVLEQSGFLESYPTRRLYETAQMILDVMRPGGLDPDGRGIASARKVRLMHAAIRRLILDRPEPTWPTDELGVPINQEDLAGTFTTFAWVPMDALRKLGVPVSPEDRDAYVGIWRYVARVMGVRDELLPQDFAGAEVLARRIQGRQVRPEVPNPAGRDLTLALLEMMEGHLPGRLLDPAPGALMRFFLPRDVSDSLGIPHARAAELYVHGTAWLLRLGARIRLSSKLRRRFYRAVGLDLLQALIDHGRGGKRTEFDLPLSLRGRWQTE